MAVLHFASPSEGAGSCFPAIFIWVKSLKINADFFRQCDWNKLKYPERSQLAWKLAPLLEPVGIELCSKWQFLHLYPGTSHPACIKYIVCWHSLSWVLILWLSRFSGLIHDCDKQRLSGYLMITLPCFSSDSICCCPGYFNFCGTLLLLYSESRDVFRFGPLWTVIITLAVAILNLPSLLKCASSEADGRGSLVYLCHMIKIIVPWIWSLACSLLWCPTPPCVWLVLPVPTSFSLLSTPKRKS